jgi:hypothetical protein
MTTLFASTLLETEIQLLPISTNYAFASMLRELLSLVRFISA